MSYYTAQRKIATPVFGKFRTNIRLSVDFPCPLYYNDSKSLGGVRHFIWHGLRLCRSGVTLEAARPCESQADAWPEAEQHRYQAILDQCDFETLVQHRYDRFCMQRRNRYMVDRSARLLSVYDGVPKGGTAQTLAYAMRQGVPVQILDPEQGD